MTAAASGVLGKAASGRKAQRALDIFGSFHNNIVMEHIGYEQTQGHRLDLTFAALANPTRRAILEHLASAREVPVGELAQSFTMTQPAISRHLKVLERAGLISRGSDAQRRPRKLEARPLREATEWLEGYREFWEASFARLDDVLRELNATGKKRKRPLPKKR
jgi:DNA-binding transcriptional ArsR family regulator